MSHPSNVLIDYERLKRLEIKLETFTGENAKVLFPNVFLFCQRHNPHSSSTRELMWTSPSRDLLGLESAFQQSFSDQNRDDTKLKMPKEKENTQLQLRAKDSVAEYNTMYLVSSIIMKIPKGPYFASLVRPQEYTRSRVESVLALCLFQNNLVFNRNIVYENFDEYYSEFGQTGMNILDDFVKAVCDDTPE